MSNDRLAHEWHLRVPAPDQLKAWMAPTQLAFGEPTSGPQVDDWARLVEVDRWLAAFESSSAVEPLGTAAALSLRLTVPGGEISAAGVTAVGVRPDHRRRGILTALMRRQLDDVRAAGEPVAILWASEGAIYQRFGYGMATFDGMFEVPTSRTAFICEPMTEGRVRLVTEAESRDLIPPIYDQMRQRTPGAVSRSGDWWSIAVLADPDHSRQGMSEKFRVIYEADGEPEGYAIYRLKPDWDQRGPKGLLEVRDVVANSPRALRALWRYLFDVDLVRTVNARRLPVPSPLQQLLLEPRALGLSVNDGLWARLVDLPAALEGRRYGAADDLVLDVKDRFCPWNAGHWRISAGGEREHAQATVTRTSDAADLALDTSDLAAAYLGGARLLDLAAVGRVRELTAGALVRAHELFRAAHEPWCGSMF